MRAHRSLRHLASELTRSGYDVLRFDYRGTGDSIGELSELSVEDWVDDTRQALGELRDRVGTSKRCRCTQSSPTSSKT